MMARTRLKLATGSRTMTKPDTPFPRHWRYYIVLKWAVIAAAIVLALKLLGVF